MGDADAHRTRRDCKAIKMIVHDFVSLDPVLFLSSLGYTCPQPFYPPAIPASRDKQMTSSQEILEYITALEQKVNEARVSMSTNQGRTQEEVSADFANRREQTIAMLKILALGQQEIDQGRYKSMDEVFVELDKNLRTSTLKRIEFMTKYVVAAFLVVLGALFLVLIRKKNDFFDAQKTEYLNSHNINRNKNKLIFPTDSFVVRNSMAISDSVFVNDTIYWQSIEISQASMGGSHTYKFDTLFFNDIKDLNIRIFVDSLRYRLRRVEDNTNTSDLIGSFLARWNLSIESGYWGVILVKNQGPFIAADLDGLIEEFIGLVRRH